MTRINTPPGWGTILDPETDERVAVDEDLDTEVAERLEDEYARVEIADDSDDGSDENEDTPEESDIDEDSLEDLTHDELKDLAEERGIDDEVDLRSKENILEELED